MKISLTSLFVLGMAALAAAGPLGAPESAEDLAVRTLRGEGKKCKYDSQCISNKCKWSYDDHKHKWVGKCTKPKSPEWGPCGNNWDCQWGLECRNHKCRKPKSPEWGPCEKDKNCQDGLVCKDHKCRKPKSPEHGWCKKDWDCQDGLKCKWDKCIKPWQPKKHGEKCEYNKQCETGRCDFWKSDDKYKICLYPPAPIGGACGWDSDCAPNKCVNHVCTKPEVPKKHHGEVCHEDKDCETGRCAIWRKGIDTKPICLYPANPKDGPCSYNSDCQSDYCDLTDPHKGKCGDKH